MATLSTTRGYDDGEVLVRADLDAFLDDIEAFLNTTKINDDNIQNSGINGATKLLNQSVTEAKIATGAITSLKITDSSVTTAKIANSAVTADKLDTDAVTTAKILDENVTTAKLADEAVTDAKLASSVDTDADRAVGTDHIKDENVTTAKIADSAVTTAKINDGAVTRAKMSSSYYTTGTSSTLSGTTIPLGSLTVSGRAVRISIIDGSWSYGSALTSGLTLQYSPDNASWSTIKTIRVAGTSAGVFTLDFNSIYGEGIPGPVTAIHTPAAGTAYYRLVDSIGFPFGLLRAVQYIIEEL